jgi:hypothetical protein
VDASAVDRLRAALAGTCWVERAAAMARSLRGAGHSAGGLLLVGTPDDEPWHLAAHLDDEARYAQLPELRPTLVRWAPPPGATPHLAVGLSRLEAVGRGETLFVVAQDAPPEGLLQRVADARRSGATVLALDAGSDDLQALAHEGLVVPAGPSLPTLDAVGHLLSAAAGAPPRRSRWPRRVRPGGS